MEENILNNLKQIDFYKQFPHMIPHVGKSFNTGKYKRLLVVAESHYLPSSSKIHLDIEWYNKSFLDLTPEEKDWTFTSNIFCNKNHKIHNNIKKAIAGAGLDITKVNDHVSFMNYFLRPALFKKGIKNTVKHIDKVKALENFIKVIDILNPELIVFVSKFSVSSFEELLIDNSPVWEYTENRGIEYTYTNHPSQPCWNTAIRPEYFKGRTSKEHLTYFLIANDYVKVSE